MIHLRPKHFRWFAGLLLICMLGCGGSKDEASAPQENGSTPPASPETPNDLPVVNVPQGGTSESNTLPRVRFETTMGSFVVELDSDRVPGTVENFLKYVDMGFYDNTIFHKVTPGYAVLGGNYTMDGDTLRLKQGLHGITNEAAQARSNTYGTIAMARDPQDADSAQCQFFINLDDNVSLDYAEEEEGVPKWQTIGYCAFGKVIEGMDVVEKIANVPVTSRNEMNRVPKVPVVISSAQKL